MKNLKYPNIEAERARRGMTSDEFAKLLGVSRKTYYSWVTKGKIPQTKLKTISNILNVSTDYLLGVVA